MSKENWKAIQRWAGVSQDGVPGPMTAQAIITKAGIPNLPRPKSTKVHGSGKNIKRIVIHCAATPEGKDFDIEDVRRWHKNQGWSDVGYHFVIKLDGTIQRGRPEYKVGSHVRGRNRGSIAICYIGGVDASMREKDTRTPEQKAAMEALVRDLTKAYPNAKVLGHRDHAGVRKACPSFDAVAWWESVK